MRIGMPLKGNYNAKGGEMRIAIIYATTKSIREAKRIANALLEERLAACINIFPIESLYRWDKKLCNEKESGIIIKTTQNNAGRAMKRIKELHSYEVPCVISWSIDNGNKKFLDWVAGEVK